MRLPEEVRPKFKGNKISFLHQLDFPIQCLISYFGALLLLVLNSAGSEVKNACHPQICLSEGKFLRRKKHILAYWVDSITDTFQWVQILETTHFIAYWVGSIAEDWNKIDEWWLWHLGLMTSRLLWSFYQIDQISEILRIIWISMSWVSIWVDRCDWSVRNWRANVSESARQNNAGAGYSYDWVPLEVTESSTLSSMILLSTTTS